MGKIAAPAQKPSLNGSANGVSSPNRINVYDDFFGDDANE
jgi:hypothetical protein